MKQLLQKLADGKPFVLDVPAPQIEPGYVLVANRYSVISAGTEGATVRSARKSLVGKALERPADVKKVLELARRQGITQAYRAAAKKLDAYSPLGYTSAGVVLEVGEGVVGFSPGDRVACAGVGYANHAEIVLAPSNLCVKLAPDADLRAAAYNALGAIALQGVRRADLRLGESCAVIGLGLVGALTCQLLKASGVKTIGIDVSQTAVEKARELGIDAYLRESRELLYQIEAQTGGEGVDATIIAAGTQSLDPINFAGSLARKRGKVVVVGAVPTGFERNPNYYPKELDLRMSCSYGPGRYDADYEEKGRDYPIAYVRWTERRNMQAFQELISAGKIDVASLTTHEFLIDDAPNAYETILKREEHYLGVVLRYETESLDARNARKILSAPPLVEKTRSSSAGANSIGVAFVGVGSYAQGTLLPNLPRDARVRRVVALSRTGAGATRAAEKFHFASASTEPADVFENSDVDAVFIATRHHLHARQALTALRNGKRVFVEKPLCIRLDEYLELYNEANRPDAPSLIVGFNRRFAPTALKLKSVLSNAPMSIVYRVNAGAIPPSHWTQDPEVGGGRILGEACHFIDFAAWISGAKPISVFARATTDPRGLNDVASIQLEMENGSIATIHYFANGAPGLAKERVEVFQTGLSAVLDDFSSLTIYDPTKGTLRKKGTQDKGQREMLRRVVDFYLEGGAAPIPLDEIFASTLAAFGACESIATRREVALR